MNGKKKGFLIGGIVAGLLIIAGVIVAILFLRKKSETFRVIKVIKAEGHCLITRGTIDDLEAYVEWRCKAEIPFL